MLKELTNDLYKDRAVALNRYVEMGLVFFNTMVALMLLTAPWYYVEKDTTFPDDTCHVSAGTVVAPFVSRFCDHDLTVIDSEWKNLHIFVWVYFGLALVSSAIIGYEVVTHGVRQWNDANTIGFAVQLGLLVIQVIIMIKSGTAHKPDHSDNSTARNLIITAVSLSSARLFFLIGFMYLTLTYSPRGFFGTGAYA